MMYNKINLMVPTYKRVESLRKFISSALSTSPCPSRLRFSFCVNEKDEATLTYLRGENEMEPGTFWYTTEDTRQPNLAMFWNLIYEKTIFNSKDTIITMLGDDMEFKTQNWDQRILDKINENSGKAIVYCDDNFIAHEKLCVNLFTTRLMVEATKKPFMCEHFHADMIDQVWHYVGKFTSTLHYLSDVIIQHNHMLKKPQGKWDETFQRLQPIQKMYSNESSMHLAYAYATVAAANVIDASIGKWDTI